MFDAASAVPNVAAQWQLAKAPCAPLESQQQFIGFCECAIVSAWGQSTDACRIVAMACIAGIAAGMIDAVTGAPPCMGMLTKASQANTASNRKNGRRETWRSDRFTASA